MHSNEEMAEWPLEFFEESFYPRLSPGFADMIRLLAIEDVEIVATKQGQLPEINLA